MSLIFGSTAAKHWYPEFREPKDLDRISEEKHMTREVEHYWNEAFAYVLANNKDATYVDPDFLYTIKVSHAAWDIWWDKTMFDIQFFKRKGCKLDKVLFDLLYAQWELEPGHRQKRVNLNVKNEEFFTKTVTRKYDHDWLHQYLAFGSEPMHNRIRRDPGSPLCSEKLWTALSYDDKVKCALEETYVIATERFRDKPPRLAKMKALKNLITSATKGWFNLFLIENYETLRAYDDAYWINKLKELEC